MAESKDDVQLLDFSVLEKTVDKQLKDVASLIKGKQLKLDTEYQSVEAATPKPPTIKNPGFAKTYYTVHNSSTSLNWDFTPANCGCPLCNSGYGAKTSGTPAVQAVTAPKPPAPPAEYAITPPATLPVDPHGVIEFDANGYAKTKTKLDIPGGEYRRVIARIREISLAYGDGKIVGRGRTRMSFEIAVEWLRAWLRGDLAKAYKFEAELVKASPQHPGAPDNTATHRVIWQPAVEGEVPAGQELPGSWPGPDNLDGNWIANYLIAARMAHPTGLNSSRRRLWVTAHMRGQKEIVDDLSTGAAKAATAAKIGWYGSYAMPIWVNLTIDSNYAIDVAPAAWSTGAIKKYAAEYAIDLPATWDERVEVIRQHLEKMAVERAIEEARLKLSAVDPQPVFGGQHPKKLLVDQHGNQWVFKPAPDEAHRFRSEIEHAAHVLARCWGFRTAESRLVEFEGRYGQIQRYLPVAHDLGGERRTPGALAKLPVDQLRAIAREHILDWAIDNDDSHGENFLVLTDGTVVGIDKGRAWRYFGGWDGLSGDASANSNAPLVYTALYDGIGRGLIDRETVDEVYRDVIRTARRMQKLPDDRIRAILAEGLANRPHYKAPSYAGVRVSSAPKSAEELITAAIARKNNLVEDMQILWQRVYGTAGWKLPDVTETGLGTNLQGHTMHTGLHSPELHAAVALTKSYGTATFVAGTDIEDAHILLWRERRPDQKFNIRGQFKVRTSSDAYAAMGTWLSQRAIVKEDAATPMLPMERDIYRNISSVASQFDCGSCKGFCTFGDASLSQLVAYIQILESHLNVAWKAISADPDDDYHQALFNRSALYLTYIERLRGHVKNKTKCTADDFPQFVYTPKPPVEEKPAEPQLTIHRVQATRIAAHLETTPKFGPDGELDVSEQVLVNNNYTGANRGQAGYMYLITLPTGEQIEFRDEVTATPLSSQGLTQFTIPDADALAVSLQRIQEQLAEMGLNIVEADLQDMELYYWRHLCGVMNDRADTRKGGCMPNGKTPPAGYAAFWAAADNVNPEASKEDQIEQWRTAFAHITSREQIDAFVAGDGHLPRFMHMDLRNPTQATGKPYWERFDVTDEMGKSKKMPALYYRTGPGNAIEAGASFATEARIRTLAIWKPGMSSSADMNYGSGGFIFTRQNQEDVATYRANNVFFSPRVLRRTTNYSFGDDKYGRIAKRASCSYYTFDALTGHADGTNELLIKDAMSVLDDVEVMVFTDNAARAQAIQKLKNLGITEIRGLPVAARFVCGDATTKNTALKLAREAFTKS